MVLLFLLILALLGYAIQAELEREDPAPAAGACPGCAAPVEADWILCPRCRARLRENCPGCNQPTASYHRYCRHCGTLHRSMP